jgi:hypothetical protein
MPRYGCPFAALPCRRSPRSARLAGSSPCPSSSVRRKAFPNSFSSGLSVIEQALRDQKAADELLCVVGALYTQRIDDGHSVAPRRKAG